MKKESYHEALASILKSYLTTNQDLTLKVTTNSMRPLIDSGDLIVVSPCGFNRLKRGDIILYSQNGTLICHRLIYKEKNKQSPFLITKGDSEFYFGKCLDFNNFLGRVTKIKKQKSTIDCNSFLWCSLNLFLGEIYFLEAGFLELLRMAKRRIFGKDRFFLTPAIKRIIHTPFYLSKGVFKFIYIITT